MKEKYFAADESENTVSHLQRKATEWFDAINQNNYLDKIKKSWDAYHGAYYANGHEVSFSGEQGELVNIPINHYRNFARHILNIVTANRPDFKARSTNTDYKSEIQTILANGLLDYYMREKRLEKFLKRACEYAIVLGSGFVKMEWNATAGEIYDYLPGDEPGKNPETGQHLEEWKHFPVYEGDIRFSNLSPFDVVFDSNKECYDDNDWLLCRSFKNKYDLAAKYPEFEEQILELRTKSQDSAARVSLHRYDDTVDVPVYEFFHRQTESLPEGRYVLYLSCDIVLIDSKMPYRQIPVYRLSSGDILGTPYGYTDMFDLLPVQNAVNSLYSTILTNQNAHGVQNIINPRGNDIRVNQLEGGMNFIEYNAQAGEPKALNLTQTPAEIFNFLQMLEKSMETISGINSVARGNPESSLKSGTALALVQAQALQFMSSLQQSYIQMIEDVGTGLVNILRDFASVPRIAAIAGINNRAKMQEFSGDDLSTINRVIVEVGNALSNTTAGRVQMAEQLLQMKLLTSPEQYLEVMNTGSLSSATEGDMDDLTLIRSENESLLSGDIPVLAIYTDKHSLHIRRHRNVTSDPKLRVESPDLVERVGAHIQEHINLLQQTDPNILTMIGEQPLGPPQGSPVSMENAAPDQPPAGAMDQGVVDMANMPEASGVGAGINEMTMPGQSPKAQLPQPAQAPQTAPDGRPLTP